MACQDAALATNLARQGEFLEKLATAQEFGYSRKQFHKTKKSISKGAPEVAAMLTASVSAQSVTLSERDPQRFGPAPVELIGRKGGLEPEHMIDLKVLKEISAPRNAGKQFETVNSKKDKIVEQFNSFQQESKKLRQAVAFVD